MVGALTALAEPVVSVVVLTWNNLAFTEACLFSLEAYSDYRNLEVIVVDNASTDGSREWLQRWAAEPALIRKTFVYDPVAGQAGAFYLWRDRASAEQIYLGRRSTLPDGRAVILVDLPAGPARDQFYLQLTRKNPSQIRAYWSRLVFTGRAQPPREAADVDDVRRILQATPGAIAYLPLDAAQDPGLIILLTLD